MSKANRHRRKARRKAAAEQPKEANREAVADAFGIRLEDVTVRGRLYFVSDEKRPPSAGPLLGRRRGASTVNLEQFARILRRASRDVYFRGPRFGWFW